MATLTIWYDTPLKEHHHLKAEIQTQKVEMNEMTTSVWTHVVFIKFCSMTHVLFIKFCSAHAQLLLNNKHFSK